MYIMCISVAIFFFFVYLLITNLLQQLTVPELFFYIWSPESYHNMATPAKVDPKPICKYGAKCYRTNEQHVKQFRHPKRDRRDVGFTFLLLFLTIVKEKTVRLSLARNGFEADRSFCVTKEGNQFVSCEICCCLFTFEVFSTGITAVNSTNSDSLLYSRFVAAFENVVSDELTYVVLMLL